jgi:hypothetical protein
MNAQNERGSGSENFEARITRNAVTVEKDMGIWSSRGKIVILGGSRGIFGNAERLEGFCVNR